MKPLAKIFRGLVIVVALASMPTGCVVSDGRVRASAVLYWPLPIPWFYGGPWMDGPLWYHAGGAFGHPPPFGGPYPHLPNRIRPVPGFRAR